MKLKEEKIFLLADDDSDDTDLFCEALMRIESTIICYTAVDGREALKLLDKLDVKPHLIFLDINMPVMSGWQCLTSLKSDQRYKEIPVIIISTSSHQRELDIARDLGALCYFTKPSDFDELKQVLEVVVKNLGADLTAALKDMQVGGSPFVCFSNSYQ